MEKMNLNFEPYHNDDDIKNKINEVYFNESIEESSQRMISEVQEYQRYINTETNNCRAINIKLEDIKSILENSKTNLENMFKNTNPLAIGSSDMMELEGLRIGVENLQEENNYFNQLMIKYDSCLKRICDIIGSRLREIEKSK